MDFEVVENDKLFVHKTEMTCDNDFCNIPDPLPKKSHTMLFVGKSGSGKTSLMVSLLASRKKNNNLQSYKKQFNHVIICSPSLSTLKNNIFKDLSPAKKFTEFDEDLLDFVDDFTQETAELEETTLLILDDVGSQLRKKQSLEKLLVSLLQNRRHRYLSCWILVQKFRDLPTGVRNNSTHMALFRPVNSRETTAIHEELLPIKKDKLNDFMDFVFDKKYNFLFVDMSLQAASGFKFYKNFDEIIM